MSAKLVSLTVEREYGYVLLVAIASYFLLVWLGLKVGGARKKFGVKYPTFYSADNDHFNCYQRAHCNTLENYTQFLSLLLIGGLSQPTIAAGLGMVWLAGRVVYALGYHSGNPASRNNGSFQYIGLIGLLGINVHLALSLLGFV